MTRKPPDDESITQTELAKRLGISGAAVTKLKKAGKIALGRDGKVAYRATLKRLGDTLDPRKPKKTLKALETVGMTLDSTEGQPEAPEGVEIPRISLAEAQRRKAAAAAAIAELELAEKQGQLVSRAGAEKKVFEFVRGFRDAMLNFPVRNAAVIAAELGVPAAKVNAALDRRLKDYLGELADRQLQL